MKDIEFRVRTFATLSDEERAYIRRTATPHGYAIHMMGLYDTDKFHSDAILAYGPTGLVGWAHVRGTLGVFVDPAHRRQGLGAALVEEAVRLFGNDLIFRTPDPSAVRMFRKYLTRGPER